LRSESSFVRSRALLNLQNLGYDSDFVNSFKEEILKLKSNPTKSTTEKETEFIDQILNQ
jgi:glutaminyl-tRNA synthetase